MRITLTFPQLERDRLLLVVVVGVQLTARPVPVAEHRGRDGRTVAVDRRRARVADAAGDDRRRVRAGNVSVHHGVLAGLVTIG